MYVYYVRESLLYDMTCMRPTVCIPTVGTPPDCHPAPTAVHVLRLDAAAAPPQLCRSVVSQLIRIEKNMRDDLN